MIRAGTVPAGRYRLEERIASGCMGEVWRAFDRVLGRTVAVKCLLTAPLDEPAFDGFVTEARTLATISHPGVVEVYDFGDDPAAGMYLIMKYIDGESLAHTLARVGRLSAEATMRLFAGWTGLAAGTYMCFQVRAYNSSGVSAYDPPAEPDWVCITTPAT